MEFQQTIGAVSVAIQVGVPVLLNGGVGEAKSSIVDALLGELCDESHTSIVALHEPPEYGGHPWPTREAGEDGDQVVALVPPAWVNRLARNKRRAGLFLDELSNGAPATRSAAMRGVLEGVWGEKSIERLSTVAAMNPPEIAESGYELSAPLANRFCHIDWDMPVAHWQEQLLAGFPKPRVVRIPEDWRKALPPITAKLAAFAKSNPAGVKAMPTSAAERSKPFPSLRTFTMLRDLVAACAAAGMDEEHDITVTLAAGCVGAGAASAFLTYAKELDLPDPEDVLRNPSKLRLPDRGDRAYAVLAAVAAAVLNNNTQQRWTAAWDVFAAAAHQGRADVAASAVRAISARENRPKGVTLPKGIDAFIPLLQTAGLL